jgi:hypothetical protein
LEEEGVEQIANGVNRWNENCSRKFAKILFTVLGKNLRKCENFAFRNNGLFVKIQKLPFSHKKRIRGRVFVLLWEQRWVTRDFQERSENSDMMRKKDRREMKKGEQ